jgi:hypothetical protein
MLWIKLTDAMGGHPIRVNAERVNFLHTVAAAPINVTRISFGGKSTDHSRHDCVDVRETQEQIIASITAALAR